ncbi:MAG: carbohydrate ABC transporter permease [Clostridiales bacterium]|nr:carbohydrate ABC transporter permease [Clostridiales bacterium]
MIKPRNMRKLGNAVICYAVLIFFSLLVLVPVAWMISTSFKTEPETIQIPPTWIPREPTIQAYIRIWKDYPFVTYFKNSLIIVLGATLLSTVVSCFAGYGVTRFNFRGKGSFMTFMLMTQMFPSIMLLIPYYKVLSIYGLMNTHLGMILVYVSFTIPFCSWMMAGFFKSIPVELDEAAIIDGCSRMRAFRSIILPLTLPGIASTAMYSFITGWNEYMFAQVLISDPTLKTVPIGIAELNGFYKILWNDMMAASLIASIPLIFLFLVSQRSFISSLTAGAVKQ